MTTWFQHSIVGPGRLYLFCFFCAFIVAFLFIRFSVRMIRAGVRWWPGNVTPGGTHIHHMVFGVVLMLVGGVAGLAVPDGAVIARAVLAALFGIGAALVMDEFALILHLSDVYWKDTGRQSIDAIFAAVSIIALVLLGISPIGVADLGADRAGGAAGWVFGVGYTLVNLAFVVVTLLKGKIWTGMLALFIPVIGIIGAVRLSRPAAPWARWRYARRPRRLERARRRERRVRVPLIRAKIAFQEFVSGKPDATVLPDAPAPPAQPPPALPPPDDAARPTPGRPAAPSDRNPIDERRP